MNEDGLKPCRRCGVPKPLTDFGADKTCRDGRRNVCKACKRPENARWQKAYNKKHPGRTTKYQRRYRERNREAYNAYCRGLRRRNPEQVKAAWDRYYAKNRDRIITVMRLWRRRNPEKVAEFRRRWNEANQDKIAAYNPLRLDLPIPGADKRGSSFHDAVADPTAVDPVEAAIKQVEAETLFAWLRRLKDYQCQCVLHFMDALETHPLEEASAETARLLGLTEWRVEEIMGEVRRLAKQAHPIY